MQGPRTFELVLVKNSIDPVSDQELLGPFSELMNVNTYVESDVILMHTKGDRQC